MKHFYLAFIVNGLFGLFLGYVWGCYDGFKAGYQNGAKSAENRIRSVLATETDKRPQSPENG
tara:strand:- start:1221 stop:1406 length:186 start_codon:yes stop_codon:yes gene_type:complete